MRLFINSLAASAGGGLTYIRNIVPILADQPGVPVTIAVGRDLRHAFDSFPNIDFLEAEMPTLQRFWYEQTNLPSVIRRCGADVLLSAGNFAVRNSPVPQILLSRNSVYTSRDYFRDLRSRGEYALWLDTHLRGWLAKKSVQWADVTVAPSEAFAAELRRWTSKPIRTIHHGFDAGAFTRNSRSLAPDVEQKLAGADGSLKLLFVSHYNYYRNFETLFRSLPLLRKSLNRPVKLLLTCRLLAEQTPGAYRPEAAVKLLKELGVTDMVVELGTVSYDQLHQVYRRADLYVTPAYTETFAHPLVEAMASGLPVVASDLAVHREICEDAAVYFSCFSPEALASAVVQVANSPEAAKRMSAAGCMRSKEFSWNQHVNAILSLATSLIGAKTVDAAATVSSRN